MFYPQKNIAKKQQAQITGFLIACLRLSLNKVLLSLLLVGTLTGCSLMSVLSDRPDSLVLLSPQSGPEKGPIKQIVTLNIQEKSVQFLAISHFDYQQTRFVALWPTGQPVMELSYDGQALKEQLYGDLPLSGRDILSIIQFSQWPEQMLKTVYQAPTWQLTLKAEQRLLSESDEPWLKVTVRPPGLVVDNYRKHYQVEIQTLKASGL